VFLVSALMKARGLALGMAALAAAACARGPTWPAANPAKLAAWNARFRAFADGLPACGVGMSGPISVEEALSRHPPRWICELVRGRLRLLVERPPCGQSDEAGPCRVRWALWSELPQPGPGDQGAGRRGLGLSDDDEWGSATSDCSFDEMPNGSVLRYPKDDRDGAVARDGASELTVAVLGTMAGDPVAPSLTVVRMCRL
jgi:hypothetical protein